MTSTEALKIVNEYICGRIYRDIENCIKAEANYVVAIALLTYTEFLGGLITGNLGKRDKTTENFNKGLGYFSWNGDSNYYKDFTVTIIEDGKRRNATIHDLFRCGMIHESFAKVPSIIHNNADAVDHYVWEDKGIGWTEMIGGPGTILRFHTNAYFRDFKAAIDKYADNLVSDPKLLTNFSTSILRIESRQIVGPTGVVLKY